MTALGEETIAPDEAALTTRFVAFLKAASAKRSPAGTPRRRFNQARGTACVQAEFTVPEGLAPEHRIGLFATPRTFQAWIRFANASSTSDRERDTRGMAIKVEHVDGPNLTPGATTQDFILNSYPVMMVPGTREFLELLEANEAGGFKRVLYFLSHPKALSIAIASRANPSCHLDIPYWSTTPYRFGPGRAVKYITRPSSTRASPKPKPLTDTYLHDAMRDRLAAGDASFDVLVQFQRDPHRTPIEDASVEWREHDAPYVPIARIRIPQQAIDDAARAARCEQSSFNPWNCLPEHLPLGSMNRARREIYRVMAEYRAAASA